MSNEVKTGRAHGTKRHLDPKHAKVPALDKLDDERLLSYAVAEIGKCVAAGAKWHSREAFYASVRVEQAILCMRIRGMQIPMFDVSFLDMPEVRNAVYGDD